MAPTYLDFNASTPIAPEVEDAMRPLLRESWGNPSSHHWASAGASEALARAREQVAALLGADAAEIVFTSGGSEANNHAIKGSVLRHLREHPTRRPHLVVSAIEHPAVIEPCRWLTSFGATLSEVPVDGHGLVAPNDVRAAMTPDTVLVSIMHANNEVGSVQPIAEIAEIAHAGGALMHTDAAQSVGKIDTNVVELGVDMLSIAGHKLYAPKGVGALFIKRGTPLDPLIHGGGHEHGRRAGTESVWLAVGLGAACSLAQQSDANLVQARRDRLWRALREAFGDRIVLNGHPTKRLPNTLNVSFVGRNGHEILAAMPEVAASTGSACHTGETNLSPVLRAMGVDPDVGRGAIRFSLGRSTTDEDVEYIVSSLREVV